MKTVFFAERSTLIINNIIAYKQRFMFVIWFFFFWNFMANNFLGNFLPFL